VQRDSTSLVSSFRYAAAGLTHLLRTQRNARIELAIGALAVALGAWLGLSGPEWAVLSLTIALVVILEGLNTALELTVDLASPERSPIARAAKDVSAGMVLVAALGSIAVGAGIFLPHLVK